MSTATQDVEKEVVVREIAKFYELVDMGIQDATLIQPCGMTFTSLKRCVIGNGPTPKDALMNALYEMHNTFKVDGNSILQNVYDFYNIQALPELPNAKAPSQRIVNNPTYVMCVRF